LIFIVLYFRNKGSVVSDQLRFNPLFSRRQALETDPRNEKALYRLGEAFFNQSQFEDAKTNFAEVRCAPWRTSCFVLQPLQDKPQNFALKVLFRDGDVEIFVGESICSFAVFSLSTVSQGIP